MATDIFNLMDEGDENKQSAVAPPKKSNVVDIFGSMDKATQNNALQNLSLEGNPEQVAKSVQISRQTAIPQPSAEQNLDQAQQTANTVAAQQLIESSPKTAHFLANNPLAARMAQDDIDNLGFIDKTIKALESGITQADITNQLGRLGTAKQAAGALGLTTPETDQEIRKLQTNLAALPQLHAGYGFVQNFTNFITGWIDNAIQGGVKGAVIGTGAGAAAGVTAGGVGAIPGALAGFTLGGTVGFFGDMARVAAGNQYLKLSEMTGSDGQPISEAGRQFGALFTGAATYAIGKYSGNLISGSAEKLAQQAIAEAVTRPTFTSAIARLTTQTAKGAAFGGAMMGSMEASSIIGEEIAKAVSPGHFDTNPQEIVDRLIDAATNGAILIGAMHAGMGGLRLYGDVQSAQRADQHMQMLKNLQEGAVNSKLRTRDLQTFQEFMQSQTDGTPVENLYIPASKIKEFYQSAGIDPMIDRASDPLFGFVGDMPKQLAEAEHTGGDVLIKTSDYIAHLAGSPISEKLLPDIRIGENAMSVNEAKVLGKQYQQSLTEAVKTAAKTEPSSGDLIAEDAQKQAEGAGQPKSVAGQYAQLMAARYSARGERLGIDPLEAYKQAGLKIQQGVEGQPKGLMQEDRAIEARAHQTFSNFETAKQAYTERPDSLGGKVLNVDVAREVSSDYLNNRTKSAAVHEPASAFIKKLYAEKLAEKPKAGQRPLVLFTAGGTGAGKTSSIENIPQTRAIADKAQIVYDTNMNTYSSAKEKVEQALKAGKDIAIAMVYRHPVEALVNGALPRAELQAKEFGTGRTVPLEELAKTHSGALDVIAKLTKEYENDDRVQIIPIDNSNGPEKATLSTLESLKEKAHNEPVDIGTLRNALETEYQNQRISKQTYEGFAGSNQVEQPGSRRVHQTAGRGFGQEPERGVGQEQEVKEQNWGLLDSASIDEKFSKFKDWAISNGWDSHLIGASNSTSSLYLEIRKPSEIDPIYGVTESKYAKIRFSDHENYRPDPTVDKFISVSPGSYSLEEAANEIKSWMSDAKQFNQPERGSIRFQDGQTIISLFNNADRSTLIHESGHAWLEELMADAQRPDAPQQLKDDMGTVLKWLGVETPDKIGTEQHEQFARGVEAYLMEGKAPSRNLASVFSKFKDWLTKIYQTVSRLNSPINPEIRQVFDRLLATDSEIEQARKTQGLEPAFKTKEEAGLTSVEWDAYQKKVDQAHQEAESKLLDKTMEKIRRQRTEEYKANEAVEKAEVSKEVDARPDISAIRLITKGVMPDGTATEAMKLNRSVVEQMYGKEELTKFPRGIFAKESGVHPDDVAETLGLPSGDSMLKSLISLEQRQREVRLEEGERRSIRQYLIDQGTDARMSQKYGDPLADGSIKDEAMKAIHGDQQADLLALELRYLNRRSSQDLLNAGENRKDLALQRATKEAVNVNRPLLDEVRAQAEAIVNNKTVDEVGKFNRYAREERVAARDVQEAILKKDWTEAADAKKRQLVANALYMKARDASEQVDRSMKMMEQLADKKTFKGISQEYIDQIHSLLERFGFKTARDSDELARGVTKSLSDFVREKYEDGYEMPITTFLASSGGDVYSMRLTDFNALSDLVTSMRQAGRTEQVVTIMGKTYDRGEAIKELTDTLVEQKQRMQSDFYRPEDKGKINEAKEKILSMFRSTNAALLKREQIFDWMDNNNSEGPFNRLIFRPLKEAAHLENEQRANLVKQWIDIENEMPKGWGKHLNDQISSDLINSDTGQPFKFTRKRMLSIALNWGAEDNATKLADGFNWNQAHIQAFLDKNMKSEDWKFVQRVWDMVGQFRNQIDEMQRRVSGVGIEFVEGRSIQTPFGVIDGKYFPLIYDSSKSIVAERNLERSRDALLENQYQRATTRNGSTISRVTGVKMPVDLSLDIVPWKLGQTVHDLAFREALMNADKLLGDREVIKAMDDSFGPEIRKTLRPWLQYIANSQNINDAAMGFADSFLNKARMNAVMVGIGFRVTTMLKHGFTALSNSVGELGPKWMGIGLKEMFGTPKRMQFAWQYAMENSAELRFRRDQYDRDISENMKAFFSPSIQGKVKAQIQEYGHLGVATLDIMSAVPTWYGALRKAQSEGMNEADSIYYADKMVRKAHGAQGITDRAAFQESSSQIYKLTGMFYGFFNHIYNRQADTVRTAAQIGPKLKAGEFRGAGNDFAQVLSRSVYYLLIPAIAEALWTHGGPDENKDEGWFEWAGKATLAEIPAGIPILRDIAKSAIEGRDYEISPLARATKTILSTGKDIGSLVGLREKEPSPKALQHAMETYGYFTGMPTGQPGATAQFLWDVAQGNEDPQSMADWWQGVVHGHVEKKGH